LDERSTPLGLHLRVGGGKNERPINALKMQKGERTAKSSEILSDADDLVREKQSPTIKPRKWGSPPDAELKPAAFFIWEKMHALGPRKGAEKAQ